MINVIYSPALLRALFFSFILVFFTGTNLQAQTQIEEPDAPSPAFRTDSANLQVYHLRNGQEIVYEKPRPFGFIKDLPKDAAGIGRRSFSREAIKPWILITGSTLLFITIDKPAIRGVENFSRSIGLHPEEEYNNAININIGGKETNLLKIPKNLNTAFYEMGQGFPSLLIGAGLYTFGKIKHDYRALSTASQLAETFILMAAGTQLVKRITGRQSPSEEPREGGEWKPFPSFKEFANHTPKYDAFPSGHLATMVSTITILSDNYPEKRWIKPIGYSITALTCFSMMNNKVHWLSDYPLAIGMGYVCAKTVVKSHQKKNSRRNTTAANRRGRLDMSMAWQNGMLLPLARYHFR